MEYKNIMKTILITGATSFIGQNLIRYLINDYKIIAVMRVNSPKINSLPNHKNLSVIQLNMDSYNTLSKILNIKNLYSFIHLSWGGTRGADRNNEQMQKENYKNSILALKAAEQLGAKIFMCAGSQAEYGQFNSVITEDTMPEPTTAYGKNKLKFYEYGMKFCSERHIKFLEPRFFSLYGIGDYQGTLIMSMLDKMLKNEPCDLTDCTQKWNFLNIKDAVNGMKILIENEDVKPGAYNFASNDTRALKRFLLEMKAITKSNSKLNFGAIPHNDSGKYGINPDITKLLATGWKPEVSFESEIKELINNIRV